MVVTNQPPYVIGIDSGTQSLRTGIFDLQGNPLIFATKEYPTYFPKPAWAEQDAADWWL
ncbi:MAG: FGGY family carbohydrate kinase, partial [Bacillota bacterium]|nr:FGGY family carbohydrate kinase [Bacillota bacterium]